MSDAHDNYTDDTPLAQLTVGQFKRLFAELLARVPEDSESKPPSNNQKKKSLDEFMDELNNSRNT